MRPVDFDPVRLRLAEQVLVQCERLGLTVFARGGAATVAAMVEGRALPGPREWERVVDELSAEIAFVLDPRLPTWFVERLPGGCRLYRPDWRAASKTEHRSTVTGRAVNC